MVSAAVRVYIGRIAWWGVLMVGLLLAAPVQAQDPQIADTTDVDVVGAIAPAEIPLRAQQDVRTLRRILTAAERDPEIIAIEEAFPEQVQRLDSLKAMGDSTGLMVMNQRSLLALRVIWLEMEGRLDGWSRTIEDRTKEEVEAEIQVLEMRALWQKTLDLAVVDSLPAPLMARIDTTLLQIDAAQAGTRERIGALLTLEDQIAEQVFVATDYLALIQETMSRQRRTRFSRDSPPLWKAWVQAPLAEQIASTRAEQNETLAAFARNNRARLLFHAMFFLLFIGALLGLRRHGKSLVIHGSDDPLQPLLDVSAYPVSTALLLALVFSIWLYPNRPLIVGEILIVLSLVPLLRVLSVLVGDRLKRPLYLLAGLLLLDLLRGQFLEFGFYDRLFLLVESVIGLLSMAWLIWQGDRFSPATPHKTAWVLVKLPWLALLFFAFSMGANLLGYVRLANVWTTATIISIGVLALLYLVVQVATGLSELLIRQGRAGKASPLVKHKAARQERVAGFVIRLAAVLLWAQVTLQRFEVFELVINGITQALERQWVVGTVSFSIGIVLTFCLILTFTFALTHLIKVVFEEGFFSREGLPRGVPAAIAIVVRYTIIAFGMVVAFSVVGLDLSRFGLLAGGLGVGLGFGFQNIIGNFISGLILAFERPINIGDAIEVDTVLGRVQEIGVRSSKVRTWDGSELIVPNSDLVSNQVINWTRTDENRRTQMPVKVAYGSDPHQVIDILLSVVRTHPDVFTDPEPMALFNGFSENGLDFTLYFWMSFDKAFIEPSAVILAVYDALHAAGIDVPIPRQDLTVREVDNGQPRLHTDGEEAETGNDKG